MKLSTSNEWFKTWIDTYYDAFNLLEVSGWKMSDDGKRMVVPKQTDPVKVANNMLYLLGEDTET